MTYDAKPWYGLVTRERALELELFARSLRELCSKFRVSILGWDGNMIEVCDDTTTLPEGYEFVALLDVKCELKIAELLMEDRPVSGS